MIRFHTPNSESGMSIIGTAPNPASGNRADVRFDGATLKLLAGVGTTSPASGIAIDTFGRVGIGTFAPVTPLAVSGGPTWTAGLWAASLSLQNASAIGWDANAAGQRFGIGHTTGGLYFFRTNSAFTSAAGAANYDMQITDAGDVIQPPANNGLVKAMAFIDRDGGVDHCYNSQLVGSAVSTPPCGITVTGIPENGQYNLAFQNLRVDNRFVSVTASQDSDQMVANTTIFAGNTVGVTTSMNHDTNGNALEHSPANFTIFVY